jgi:UDP-N-acetylglucosamine 2-epimerase (non-hydrolysing)
LKKRKKIISVVGARPNFMKLAPLVFELKKNSKLFEHKIVHTGQHYDFNLSKVFFKDLHLPKPDIYLEVGSSSHGDQTAKILQKFEQVLIKEKPDLVVLFGDINSTLACSIACSKILYGETETIPVAHVEAGLRSFDKTMPEEINRIVTDILSKYLFVTEKAGVYNLLNEGISKDRIFLSGNVMVDALKMNARNFNKSGILKKLQINKGKYVLITIHRPVNVDNISNAKKIIDILKGISDCMFQLDKNFKIVFPVHPRTLKMLDKFKLYRILEALPNIVLIEPAGYSDFINMLINCKFVLTDSGGIQEEATFLKVPCLTLRDSFERPETIEIGSNTLCALNYDKIMKNVGNILKGKYKRFKVPALMDGKASERIVKIIKDKIL